MQRPHCWRRSSNMAMVVGWENPMLDTGFIAVMQRRLKERAITRVVHFTRVTSLVGIINDGQIESTRSLLDRGVEGVVNDAWRFDDHLDCVCCSIRFPNVYLLDRYRAKDSAQHWVVLLLVPGLLFFPTTRYSPVNAATSGGAFVKGGIEGFESMFEKRVSERVRRGPHHLQNCPTDIQAEVLVASPIPMWAITGIAVESDAVAAKVESLLAAWPIDNLPSGWSSRPTVLVQRDMFDKTELPKTIRGPRR